MRRGGSERKREGEKEREMGREEGGEGKVKGMGGKEVSEEEEKKTRVYKYQHGNFTIKYRYTKLQHGYFTMLYLFKRKAELFLLSCPVNKLVSTLLLSLTLRPKSITSPEEGANSS